MIQPLCHLASVRAGYPFRGSVEPHDDGQARVIQMRDVSDAGDIAWSELVRTQLDTQRPIDCLQHGDILFVARGRRNHAVCLTAPPADVVCAQHFFVLRCKGLQVRPPYLAWFINRQPAQRFLARNAEGSDQLSIRRGVLEAIAVPVPSLAQQDTILALADASAQERRCLQALMTNLDTQLDGLAQQLLGTTP